MMNQLFIRGYKQWRDDSMIREIENRRSIRKYKPDELDRKLIEEIIYSASLAPSAKTGSLGNLLYIRVKKKINWLMSCVMV